jgi:hypothetical protein
MVQLPEFAAIGSMDLIKTIMNNNNKSSKVPWERRSVTLLSALALFTITVLFATVPKCDGAQGKNQYVKKFNNGKKMRVLILGAAGQIGKLVTNDLLEQTDYDLVLYGRNVTSRLSIKDTTRTRLVNGDFKNREALMVAMQDVDAIYLNDMNDAEGVATIVSVMKEKKVKRIIVASILGIYNEVPGEFGKWNERMVGASHIKEHAEHVKLVENPELDYTILRLTWLYNQSGNRKYELTQKGEPFKGAQVTREAVSQLVVDILKDSTGQYVKKSLGVGEPNTNFDKPSFY